MPKYLITFNDGSSIEKEAPTVDAAKQAAKLEAQQRSGAKERTDPRVKVESVANLDEQPGPTDPRRSEIARRREQEGRR
jgi:hypothetical protein